ncbi:hypothetical protein PIB30_055227 [Stylosanthes scabra]|uniref:Uncharacterized protein n=1 Tax=Stylosanthes scabra TaxID=79078 RepID=A0ABU6UJV5_9FABA|nr:hypothetical protein [Stylosanthes scabra]
MEMGDMGDILEDSQVQIPEECTPRAQVLPLLQKNESEKDNRHEVNLDLTVEQANATSVKGDGKDELCVDVQTLLLMRVAVMTERIDSNTGKMAEPVVNMSGRVDRVEGCMYYVNQIVRDLAAANPRPMPGGTPPACAQNSPTSRRTRGGKRSLNYTHDVSPMDKGKGLAETRLGGMLDIVAPDSPDDDVIIDETKSTPRPRPKTAPKVVATPPTDSLFWSVGAPKHGYGQLPYFSGSVSAPNDNCLRELPNISQLDSSAQICALFSSSPDASRPSKISKVEQDMVSSHMPPLPAINLPIAPTETATGVVGQVHRPVARGWLQGSLFRRYESPTLLIPLMYEMVFRPTVNMDLSIEETIVIAYIFKKVDPHGSELPPHGAAIAQPICGRKEAQMTPSSCKSI